MCVRVDGLVVRVFYYVCYECASVVSDVRVPEVGVGVYVSCNDGVLCVSEII